MHYLKLPFLSQDDDIEFFLNSMNIQAWSFIDVTIYGWANRIHANFFGFKPEDLTNKDIYSLLNKKTAEILTENNEIVFYLKKPIVTNRWIYYKDGTSHYLHIKKIPLLDDKQQVVKILCMAVDLFDSNLFKEQNEELTRINMLLTNEIKERERSENALQRRILFEQTLSFISSQFVKLSDIDESIIKSLKAIGELCGVDRCYVVLLDINKKDTLQKTHEWCAEGVQQTIDIMQDIPASSLPYLMEQLYNGQYVYLKDKSSLPDSAIYEKKRFDDFYLKSSIIFPIFNGKNLIGYVGFDNVIRIKTWQDDNITELYIFAELLGKILERRQNEKVLQKSEELYRAIFETTSAPTVILENNGTIIMANKKFLNVFGSPELDTNNKKSLLDYIINNEKTTKSKTYDYCMIDKTGNIRNVFITMDEIPNSEKSIASIMDITALKKAENELHKSYVHLQTLLEDTVDALASVLEVKDPYTAGHQRKVANLATTIAIHMGLDEKQIEGLKVACLLHDIGKIYVPSEILNKPSKLSEIEMTLIKEHPRVGYDIVKRVNFPWPVAEIISQHHERIDGSGYPLGLKDKDICFEAKILAVADVVEALTSHRPYRPALKIEMALNELTQNRNILYDSNVVDTFIGLIEKKEIAL